MSDLNTNSLYSNSFTPFNTVVTNTHYLGGGESTNPLFVGSLGYLKRFPTQLSSDQIFAEKNSILYRETADLWLPMNDYSSVANCYKNYAGNALQWTLTGALTTNAVNLPINSGVPSLQRKKIATVTATYYASPLGFLAC